MEACMFYERAERRRCDPLVDIVKEATLNYFIKCKYYFNLNVNISIILIFQLFNHFEYMLSDSNLKT